MLPQTSNVELLAVDNHEQDELCLGIIVKYQQSSQNVLAIDP